MYRTSQQRPDASSTLETQVGNVVVAGPADAAARLGAMLEAAGCTTAYVASLDHGAAIPRLVAVDSRARQVRLEHGGFVRTIEYDRLALMSVPVFGPITGLHEHSVDVLNDRNRAWALAHIASLPRRIRTEHRPDRRAALANVVILGAGRRGIELAGQLASSPVTSGLGIVLVDGRERVLPELPEADERRLLATLEARGVLVLRGFEPQAVGPLEVRFPGGARIPARTVLRAEAWEARPGWSCIPVGGLDLPIRGNWVEDLVDLGLAPRSSGLYEGFGAPDETWYRSAAQRLWTVPEAPAWKRAAPRAWAVRQLPGTDVAHVGRRSLAGPLARVAGAAIGRLHRARSAGRLRELAPVSAPDAGSSVTILPQPPRPA